MENPQRQRHCIWCYWRGALLHHDTRNENPESAYHERRGRVGPSPSHDIGLPHSAVLVDRIPLPGSLASNEAFGPELAIVVTYGRFLVVDAWICRLLGRSDSGLVNNCEILGNTGEILGTSYSFLSTGRPGTVRFMRLWLESPEITYCILRKRR